MANYRTRNLKNVETTTTPLEPLLGGRAPRKDRVLSVFNQVDRLFGNSRRIVARVGLAGSAQFQVVSSNPSSGGTQVYPLKTAERVAARSTFALSPGCMLRFSGLFAPSGMTQRFDAGVGQYVSHGAMGEVIVRCTFNGLSSETVEYKLPLHVSQETWAAEDTDAGATWAGLKRYEIPFIAPTNIDNPFVQWKYSEAVTCELEIVFRGGVRCVDAFVSEVPYQYTRDLDTDAVADFSMVLATEASGQAVANFPVPYPIEERSAANPCYGSRLLADVVHRQQNGFGPCFVVFTSWDEASQSVTATQAAALTTSSTSFVDLLRPSLTAWSANNPGWSLSSGGTSQQFRSSNALRELRDVDAVVPVRFHVYGSRSVSGTATIRFQTKDYSIADLTIGSSTEGWYSSCVGHMRCGLGAEDASVLQMLAKVSTALSTLSVRALVLEYVDA